VVTWALLVLATAPASDGWFLRNQLSARVNPVGLFNEARVGYRVALGEGSQASIAANASISPAFARGGVAADVTVHPALTFSAIYEGGGMFGTFALPQTFPGARGARWDDASREGRAGTATAVHQLILGAFIDLRAGRFLVRGNHRLVLQQLALPAGAPVFYDQNWETLMDNGGWLTVNDVDVLVQTVAGLRVGVRYDFTHAFLRDLPSGLTTQRVGPLVSWLLAEQVGPLASPTLALVLNWWIQHPSRVGVVPYVGVAFTFRVA
jgi:hypothetical protein